MLRVEEGMAVPARLPLFPCSWGTSHHSLASAAAAAVVVEQLLVPEDAKKTITSF